LRDAGLDHIQLSIQGSARESAETIAGVRSHRKKLEVARLIRQTGFPLTLNVVIHRLNIAEVPEFIAIALELGADRLAALLNVGLIRGLYGPLSDVAPLAGFRVRHRRNCH